MSRTSCYRCDAPLDGSHKSYCKACACVVMKKHRQEHYGQWQETSRRSHLKGRYGITTEEYDRMRNAQAGRCAICALPDVGIVGHSFYVDHDHRTDKVRGLLCTNCNKALGFVYDDILTLKAMIRYLEKHGAPVLEAVS